MHCSAALDKFSERLAEVEILLSLCSPPEANLQKQTAAAHRDNAILRAALVLLCSHIEGFFEDLVGDVLLAYGKIAEDLDKIPQEIFAYQVIGKPERWNNSDVLRRWQIVQECILHPLVTKDRAGLLARIDPEIHTKGFANPGTREIEVLFRTVGIPEIWDNFARIEPDRLIKETVDSIVNRRNQIAHGQMDSTVTRIDVEGYLAKARRLAQVMDSLVEDQICSKLSLKNAWALAQQKAEILACESPSFDDAPLPPSDENDRCSA